MGSKLRQSSSMIKCNPFRVIKTSIIAIHVLMACNEHAEQMSFARMSVNLHYPDQIQSGSIRIQPGQDVGSSGSLTKPKLLAKFGRAGFDGE